MDERIRQTLLYDFYGELLSEHQKEVYCAAIFDDMSYSELSEEFGVSRQAVFDLINRTSKKLESYESRLGLLERFQSARFKVSELFKNIDDIKSEIESLDPSGKDTKVKKALKKIDDIKKESKDIFETL